VHYQVVRCVAGVWVIGYGTLLCDLVFLFGVRARLLVAALIGWLSAAAGL
jgi:hypothetical protein